MDELTISIYLFSALLFVIAFAYSSVGMGGGSSYTALMAIFGVSYLAIPTVSLVLNLFVTTVGSVNFIRKKHANWKLIAPFLIASIPFAYLGGMLKLPKDVFNLILLATLLLVALRIYVWKNISLNLVLTPKRKIMLSLLVGAVLGFVAGTVGIGGGVYLVPLVILFNLGSEKQAAACGAVFIWVNSMSGLAARLQHNPIQLLEFLPLIITVLLGGFIGSHLGSSKFSPNTMQKLLGIIIIVAIVFLLKKVIAI